jgi:Ca-activated chloride channel family protein
MPEFAAPLFLGLIPLLAGAWFLLARRRRPPALRFPTVRGIVPARTLRLRLRRLPAILRAAAVVLLVVAAARPREGISTSAIRREGLAIQMVLDRSGSMDEELALAGRPAPKIEIVKRIFADFVAGGEELPGRPTDLIGLTTFARFAEENCPLVGLHEPLLSAVRNLATVTPFLTAARSPTRDRREAAAQNPLNATAIGDGLKRAVLALIAAEEDLARSRDGETDYTVRGKVAILLTDGRQNAGSDPLEAADLAKKNDVRIYSIVLAGRDVEEETIFGRRVTRRLSEAELADLVSAPKEVAERTGGKWFLAEDGDALRKVYAEIDRLEKSDLGEIVFRSYRERFAIPLILGILLLVLAEALGETIFRRTP